MDSKKLMAIAAVPVMLAFGALGFTQQGNAQNNSATSQSQTTQQAENTKADPDNVQQGDQTSPDRPGQTEEQEAKGPDRDNNIQQGGGNQVEDGKPDLSGVASEDGS